MFLLLILNYSRNFQDYKKAYISDFSFFMHYEVTIKNFQQDIFISECNVSYKYLKYSNLYFKYNALHELISTLRRICNTFRKFFLFLVILKM